MEKLGVSLVAIVLSIASTFCFVGNLHAGAPSDLECYKVKDPLKLKAVADLSALGGLAPGCKIGKAKQFCVPADHSVVSAVNKGAKPPATISPLPVPGPDAGMRICYPIKCPEPFPVGFEIVDTFGIRTVSKLKPSTLCVPAYENKPVCTAPQPAQCAVGHSCTAGFCSTTGGVCTIQANCPLQPNEQCCCGGTCS